MSWPSETTTTPLESSPRPKLNPPEPRRPSSLLGHHSDPAQNAQCPPGATTTPSHIALTSSQEFFCGVRSFTIWNTQYPFHYILVNPRSDRRHTVVVNGNKREPHTPYSWFQYTRSMGSIVVCHWQCPPCHSFKTARYYECPLQFSQENILH